MKTIEDNKEDEEKILLHRLPDDEKWNLDKNAKDLLAYMALFQTTKQKAYALFHPEYCVMGKLNSAGIQQCEQFFSLAKNKNYLKALRLHVASLIKGFKEGGKSVEITDTRKDKALKSLLNKAMLLIEDGRDLDADGLKTVTEIFRKVGLIKDDVEVQIHPQRYLPEQCRFCRYKSFVESAVKEQAIEDECSVCKAMQFAKENGFIYDPTNFYVEKNKKNN